MDVTSWLIKGGTLVIPECGEVVADIHVDNGIISAMGTNLPIKDCKVYNANGKYVFPGFIDTHVHLGNFNRFEDDCLTETKSAAAGGVTTIFHFAKILKHRPNQTSYHEIFDELFSDIERLSSVDVALHLHLSTYEHVEEIPSYARRGVTSFKFYLSYRGSKEALDFGTVGVGDGVVYAGLQEIAKIPGAIAIIHCENDDLVEFFQRSIVGKDKISFIEFANSRPAIAEAEHVRRICYYSDVTGGSLYIPHVTSKEALMIASKYRKTAKFPIYLETCPQYLLLTKYDANKMIGATAKTYPPVREKESLDALWEGINTSIIDTVGSDHVAVGLNRKTNLWEGVGGFPGLETRVPLIISEAQSRGISLTRVAQVCSYNAACIFGLLPQKGTLRIGSDGDITIIDLNPEKIIKATDLHSSSDFTPYEGFSIKAQVEATFLRGQLIWREGNLIDERQGQVVHRYGIS